MDSNPNAGSLVDNNKIVLTKGQMRSSALKRLRKAVSVHQAIISDMFFRTRIVLVLLLAALIGLLVAHQLILSHYTSNLDADIAIVGDNAERLIVALDGVYHHRSLRLHEEHPDASALFERDFVLQEYSSGAFMPTSGDALNALIKRRALYYLNEVGTLSQTMSEAHMSSSAFASYSSSDSSIIDIPSISATGQIHANTMNIDEAVFQWLAAGRATLIQPDGSAADAALAATFETTGYTSLFRVSEEYSGPLHRGISSDASYLYAWTIVVALFALVLIVLVGVFIILPTVRAVEATKTQILGLFLEIPAEVRRLVRKRLLGLRGLIADRDKESEETQAGDGDWMGDAHKEGDDDDDSDDNDSATRSLVADAQHSVSLSATALSTRHSTASSTALLLPHGSNAAENAQQGNLTHSSSSSSVSVSEIARSRIRQQCYAAFAANRAPAPSAAAARYNKLASKGLAGRPDLLFHGSQGQSQSRNGGSDANAKIEGALVVDLTQISRKAAAAASGSLNDDVAAKTIAVDQQRIDAHRADMTLRSVITRMSVFSLLLLLLLIHAVVIIPAVDTLGSHYTHLGSLIKVNGMQSAHLSHALFTAREHLILGYADRQTSEPTSPYLSLGPFPAVVSDDVSLARAAHRSVVYGDPAQDLTPMTYRSATDSLNFGSLCGLAPLLPEHHVIGPVPATDADAQPVFDALWGACVSQLGGALVKGLDALMLFACDAIEGLVGSAIAESSFATYLAAMPPSGPSPSDGSPYAVFSAWKPLERLVLDYLAPVVLLTGVEYTHIAHDTAQDTAELCLLLSIAVGGLALLLACVVFRQQLLWLQNQARHAVGALLLLTPELTRTVAGVSVYVQDHCSRE
jgi:hypothetical protein